VSFLEDPSPLAEAGTTTQSVWLIRTSLVMRKKCRSLLRHSGRIVGNRKLSGNWVLGS
jgi:hypothetical protein